MPPRSHDVNCSVQLAQTLAEAIGDYANAAYPPGGSECAQSARETLLTTAAACTAHQGGALKLPRRQLALIRAAVRWYYEQQVETCAADAEHPLLIKLLERS